MQENETRPYNSDNDPRLTTESSTEPLLGSGFEEEQPEPDFDERM
jgi:hypothetical protein